MTDRVIFFVDWENLYRGALAAFHPDAGRRTPEDGQVNPIQLGELICSRPPPGFERELVEVRVYRGQPNPLKDARTHAAHMRQRAAWERDGAIVLTRPLQYLTNQPPREKGIDVQIAVDFVAGAIEGRYDIGIMFSADTDLRPPLEYVFDKFAETPRAEVAAWRTPTHSQRLSLRGRNVWCHYLDETDYQRVRDATNYARPRP